MAAVVDTDGTCLFCTKFFPSVRLKTRLAWTTLCRISFLSINPNEYINVRQLFIFISKHWDKLCHLEQLRNENWRKFILDALNHSSFFKSGISVFHTCGYWKLVDTTIPSIKTRNKNKVAGQSKKPQRAWESPFKPCTSMNFCVISNFAAQ